MPRIEFLNGQTGRTRGRQVLVGGFENSARNWEVVFLPAEFKLADLWTCWRHEDGRIEHCAGLELNPISGGSLEIVLKKCSGKIFGKNGAAELLGINASTLNSRIKKLGINKTKFIF